MFLDPRGALTRFSGAGPSSVMAIFKGSRHRQGRSRPRARLWALDIRQKEASVTRRPRRPAHSFTRTCQPVLIPTADQGPSTPRLAEVNGGFDEKLNQIDPGSTYLRICRHMMIYAFESFTAKGVPQLVWTGECW